jgi:hypothetical protein
VYELDELNKFPSFIEMVPGASQKLSKKKKKAPSTKSQEKSVSKKKPKAFAGLLKKVRDTRNSGMQSTIST